MEDCEPGQKRSYQCREDVRDRKLRQLLQVSILLAFLLTSFSLQAAELQLKNLQGETQSLQNYGGRIVLLNFWATWCLPCREEMPLFVELQKRYESSGVQFIAVSIDTAEDLQKVHQFAKEFRLNFPVWVGATIEQQASLGLGTAVPATAIYDQTGKIAFRIIGQSKRFDVEKRLQFLLSGQTGSQPDVLLLPPGISAEHFEQHHARVGAEEDHHDHGEQLSGSEVPS